MIHKQKSLKFITVKFRYFFRGSINMQSQGLTGYHPESGTTLVRNTLSKSWRMQIRFTQLLKRWNSTWVSHPQNLLITLLLIYIYFWRHRNPFNKFFFFFYPNSIPVKCQSFGNQGMGFSLHCFFQTSQKKTTHSTHNWECCYLADKSNYSCKN